MIEDDVNVEPQHSTSCWVHVMPDVSLLLACVGNRKAPSILLDFLPLLRSYLSWSITCGYALAPCQFYRLVSHAHTHNG